MNPSVGVSGLAIMVMLAGCASQKVSKARTAIDAGQPDIAISLLTEVLGNDPANVDALVALGDASVLLSTRQLAADDKEGSKTALAKAEEAYASAASLEDGGCTGATRSMTMRLLRMEELDDTKLAALWERCPSAELLGAVHLGGPTGGLTVGEMRKSLKVELGEWSQAPGFGGPLSDGVSALTLESVAAHAVGDGEKATLHRFESIEVLGTSDGYVSFDDESHPVGRRATSWVSWYNEDGCKVRGRDACRQGLVRRPLEGIAPFEGDVACTGKARMFLWAASQCEVEYMKKTILTRSVPEAKVIAQPNAVRSRGRLLSALLGVVPEEELSRLAGGEVAPGLPLTDVHGVVPGCSWSPMRGQSFRGGSVVRTCETALGSLVFVDGLLESVTWNTTATADRGAVRVGADGE